MLGMALAVAAVVAGQPAGCATPSLNGAASELCLGQQEMAAGDATKEPDARTRHLESAARHFERAVNLSNSSESRAAATAAMLVVFDPKHLNDLAQLEHAARSLVVLNPADVTPLYTLAKAQEDDDEIDQAETTLVDVRHLIPNDPEPYKRLAQFYARRATAMQRKADPPKATTNPGEADADGIYQVGGGIAPPTRLDRAVYPPEAVAAGVQGTVQAEIVINEQGDVSKARVVQSVPMLDDAALAAVKNWHFQPTTVQGQAVPVRMTVTVAFTTK